MNSRSELFTLNYFNKYYISLSFRHPVLYQCHRGKSSLQLTASFINLLRLDRKVCCSVSTQSGEKYAKSFPSNTILNNPDSFRSNQWSGTEAGGRLRSNLLGLLTDKSDFSGFKFKSRIRFSVKMPKLTVYQHFILNSKWKIRCSWWTIMKY